MGAVLLAGLLIMWVVLLVRGSGRRGGYQPTDDQSLDVGDPPIDYTAIMPVLTLGPMPKGTYSVADLIRDERHELEAEVERLRAALRGVLNEQPRGQLGWCWYWRGGTGFKPCGACSGCLAWQQAQATIEEVGDGTE